jgi:mannonate dehydratase
MLTAEHYDFARQAGCTHVIIHLVDYFRLGASNPRNNQPIGERYAHWGIAADAGSLWTVDEMRAVKSEIESAGLCLAGIENLDPGHWHDVLLDGPRRGEQIENVKTIVRRMGEVGIPVLGYNFSIAGVCGRTTGPFGRGHAITVGMDGPADDVPVSVGTVWNMVYDERGEGFLPSISHEELWRRLRRFLEEIIPVAEKAGVRLALHPDDPPMPTMRRQPRLVYQPAMYQRALDAMPSSNNALELCVGTLAEMTQGDVYDAVDRYSRQGKVAYVHLRNVKGKVPHYRETFIDEGDVDMVEILTILKRNGFDGVLIPDHAPQMSCSAPWHAGMAHTIGFMTGVLATLEKQKREPKGGIRAVSATYPSSFGQSAIKQTTDNPSQATARIPKSHERKL